MSAPDPSRVLVTSDDPRLSDARPPSTHTHPVSDIEATGTASAATVLFGDGRWDAPPTGGGGASHWDDLDGKPATFPPTIGTTSTTAKAGNYVPSWSEVTSKPTTFPPTAHTHDVPDINATGRTTSNYLRGDGTWATPTNTTYTVMSEAEATAGTATTARATSAAGLKGAIQRWATGTYSTAISAIGQALNRAATAADARAAIGAGTSDLAIGTTSTTAKAGNYVPTWTEVTSKPTTFPPDAHSHTTAQVTGLDSALAGKVIASGATTTLWSGTQAQYDALAPATKNAAGFIAIIA